MLVTKSYCHRILFILCNVLFLTVISCQRVQKKEFKKEETQAEDIVKEKNTAILYTPFIVKEQHARLNGAVKQFVWEMYEDSSGNFWFCTNGDGIVIYNYNGMKHHLLKEGNGGAAVRDILEDPSGNIWLGTSKGLMKYDGATFKLFTQTGGVDHNEIWSIEQDAKGVIWIGSVAGVSTFYNEEFKHFPIEKATVKNATSMLSKDRVSDIMIAKNGTIWFVTDGYGISTYDGNRFETYSTGNGLTDNSVADLFQDRNGTIWIGTFYGGVSTYDGEEFTNFSKDGLIEGIEAYNFIEDTTGNIWFSVENTGVYRYDGNTFKLFTMQDGLATNTIQGIYEDDKEQIWFSTWDGLSIYANGQIMDAALIEPWAQ